MATADPGGVRPKPPVPRSRHRKDPDAPKGANILREIAGRAPAELRRGTGRDSAAGAFRSNGKGSTGEDAEARARTRRNPARHCSADRPKFRDPGVRACLLIHASRRECLGPPAACRETPGSISRRRRRVPVFREGRESSPHSPAAATRSSTDSSASTSSGLISPI